MPNILIVDDEQAIRRFLDTALSAQGYTVQEAASGAAALEIATTQQPDLIILDLGLPDIPGVEVTRQLRVWTQLPIIILSIQETEEQKIAALDAGADDYLSKPFSTGELLARIRAALRRANPATANPILKVGELSVDRARRRVTLAGQEIALTPTEYELLCVLLCQAGKVLTHRQLLTQVWGEAYANELHLLRVNISNLRQKIEPNPTRPLYILTEPGIGYRLRTE